MAKQETQEGVVAINKTLNSVKQAAADGKFTLEDIAYFIDDIGAWTDAVNNLILRQEAQTVTNVEVTEAFDAGAKELTAFSAEDQFDIINMQKGAYGIFRLITRNAYKKGFEAGRAAALAELKKG